jgi:hypothetical protein
MARDGAQTEILRVAIASELNIPTTELTAKSYPAAGGVTHTEETFDCSTHAAQATPAQLIDPNLELTVSDLPDGGFIHHQPAILRHTLVDHVRNGAAVSRQPGMQASGEHRPGGRGRSERALATATWVAYDFEARPGRLLVFGSLSRPPRGKPAQLPAKATQTPH